MNVAPRILFLSKYARNGASSRYRVYQYLPSLERSGFVTGVAPLFDEDSLVRSYRVMEGRRLTDVARAFCRRVASLLRAKSFDLVVIEYELLPYFPAFLEKMLQWSGVRYVVDYDDALFHQYDQHSNPLVRTLLGQKIATVMHSAELVIAGNAYLADYARHAGAKRVEILPTVVDLDRYPTVAQSGVVQDTCIIGWIGSPSTSKYLAAVAPALAEVCRQWSCKVRLIGAVDVPMPEVPVEVLPWSEQSEVDLLRSCDVGIMPLPDEPWTRGKCGFKLIQYMACGLPVIASPVGVNQDIVEHGVNGFLSGSTQEWVQALETLLNDPELRIRMGEAGRRKVEEKYSLQVTAPRYVELLRSVVEKH